MTSPIRFAWLLLVAGVPAACVVGCSGSPDESAEANPSASEALTMPACGTVLASFDGVAAYSNGNDTSTGYSCAGSGKYGLQYQCVELVMRYFKIQFGLSWHGNAKDLLANAPKSDVDVYSNGDAAHPPVPGDMIVWPNGAYGHVALVTGVQAGAIQIIEQNVKGSGSATLTYANGKIGARWGTWVPSGWAHAKANGATVDVDAGTDAGDTDAGGGGTDAGGGGVSWSCASSAYNGHQYWTCSGDARYECVNGVPQMETCPNGCQVNAVGTDDTCKNAVNWNCASSAYNGKQYWTCSGNARYECVNGVPQMESCPNGCVSQPLGSNDYCK